MRLGYHVVPLQEGHGAVDIEVRFLLMSIDTHDVHFVGIVQPYSLEHLQGPNRVQAPVVCNDHYPPRGQCGGDSDDRTWTLLQHRVEGGIRLLLSFKVKKGVLPKHDEVILLGLQENLLGWEPGILEYLARYTGLDTSLCTVLQELLYFMASVLEQGGIMVHFVSTAPERHGLRLADGWGIDNPQPYEHGTSMLRPSDTKFHCGCAVRRTVYPN